MAFVFATVAVFNLFVWFMPKKITWIEIYGTVFFTLFIQLIIDVYLDLKYDLYGYFTKGVDYETLIFILGVYPAINLIIVNFYPKDKGLLSKTFYILAWSAFSLGYEFILVYIGVFYHNGWHLWYSALVYPILIIILLLNLKLLLAIKTQSVRK